MSGSEQVQRLAFFLEVEHAIAIGITEKRADLWSDALASHRDEHPNCSVCQLLRDVGYLAEASV